MNAKTINYFITASCKWPRLLLNLDGTLLVQYDSLHDVRSWSSWPTTAGTRETAWNLKISILNETLFIFVYFHRFWAI